MSADKPPIWVKESDVNAQIANGYICCADKNGNDYCELDGDGNKEFLMVFDGIEKLLEGK